MGNRGSAKTFVHLPCVDKRIYTQIIRRYIMYTIRQARTQSYTYTKNLHSHSHTHTRTQFSRYLHKLRRFIKQISNSQKHTNV